MIAKLVKGKGFRGAVEYDLQPGKSVMLETNMAGATPRSLAAEFGSVRALRARLAKAVCHVSLSIHPDEHLSDDQWREAAHAWLDGMGFVNNQYIISRHTDSAHAHVHILANRVSLDGQVVSDSHDYKRQEPIMRRLEKQFGLRMVPPSQQVGRAALTKGEIERCLRTGETSMRIRLQQAVDTALGQGCPMSMFRDRLAQVGVGVRLNTASTGFVSGISFALDDVAFKGSKLGKGYTWNALQQRGLYNEQDRRCEEKQFESGSERKCGLEQNESIESERDRESGYTTDGFSKIIERGSDGHEQTTILSDQEFHGNEFTFGKIDEINKRGKRQRKTSIKRCTDISF